MAESGPIAGFWAKYAFLSNFHPSEIEFEGACYPTVEHAFQAAKTSDPEARRKVREASTPGGAKRIGRRVRLRADWESVKVGVMTGLLRLKFADPELGALLLATGARELIEENSWNDRFWGTTGGVGRNELGQALMVVRAEIQSLG